jgi:hypothetical protein
MSAEEDEAFATHILDQIYAAKAEHELKFQERARALEVEQVYSSDAKNFSESYFGKVFPWIEDFSLRDNMTSCGHVDSPQPIWCFFFSPNTLYCEPCSESMQFYREKTLDKNEHFVPNECDICHTGGQELDWVFASVDYFTLAGRICLLCFTAHGDSIKIEKD